jgi:SAM-dependent methyltransferase
MKLRAPGPQRLLLEAIDRLLSRPGARIVDVGAGSVVEKNRRAGQHALADRYEQLTQCRGYFGLDVSPGSNVAMVGDAHLLPLAAESLDGVIMVSVLEHLYDPTRAVSEVGRVLKPGGLFFSYAPFYHPYHASPHDYFRFTEEGYRILLKGFREIDLVSGGNYVAVWNDVTSYALGKSRVGRLLARGLVEAPASLLFRTLDPRLKPDIAVGFAALAVK